MLLISLVLEVGLFALLWFCAPLRKSSMTVDPNEIEKRAIEVQQRERQRVEQERLRREKVAIKESESNVSPKADSTSLAPHARQIWCHA